MSRNREEVRTLVRDYLQEFYDKDILAVAVDADDTPLTVTDISKFKIGDTIQIDTELMVILAVDTESTQISVARGAKESTAAAHSESATIKIIPEVTDRMVNDAIARAVGDTYGDHETGSAGIWINALNTDLETDTEEREYTIPSGISFISTVEIEDSNGNFQITHRWRKVSNKLVFTADFSESGRTIRLDGMYYQTILTDDTTNFTLSDETVDSFIVKCAALNVIETRLAHRIKASEYAAAVNERAGQPSEMMQAIGFLRRTVQDIKRRESKPMKSGYATGMVR